MGKIDPINNGGVMHTTSTPSGIKCRVTIKTASGSRSYSGVFPSTIDATIDAMDQLGDGQGRISVKVLP
jgi:hypothetical protein